MGSWYDNLGGLLGTAGDIWSASKVYDDMSALGDRLEGEFSNLAGTARSNTQFTPFTITGTGGSATASATDGGGFGGLSVNLDATTQAGIDAARNQYKNHMQNYSGVGAPTLGGGGFTAASAPSIGQYNPVGGYWSGGPTIPTMPGQVAMPSYGTYGGTDLPGKISTPGMAGLFAANQQNPLYSQAQASSGLQGALGSAGGQIINQLGIGTGRTEGELFNMMEAMQEPGRERERLALRDELAAQGRLGVQTAAYGGTPEELARAKAVEEARSGNAMRAFQLAGEEQGRLANQRLNAFQIGEQAAGRQDQGLLQSFGIGTDSQRAATDLTNVLGSLGLQGQDIGNRYLQNIFGTQVQQRGQDLNAMLQGQDIGSRYDLGLLSQAVNQRGQEANFRSQLYDTGMRGSIAQGDLAARADQLGAQSLSDYNQILSQVYGIDAQQAMEQGRQAVDADRNAASLFGSQVQQNLGQLQAMDQYYRSSFLPEQNLLDQLGLGADMYELQQRGLIQGEQMAQNADINRLQQLYNTERDKSHYETEARNTILETIFGGQQNAAGDVSGGLFGNMLKGIFGDSVNFDDLTDAQKAALNLL